LAFSFSSFKQDFASSFPISFYAYVTKSVFLEKCSAKEEASQQQIPQWEDESFLSVVAVPPVQ
jgi:hypothetical protein